MKILLVLGHNRLTGVNTWAYTLAKEFKKHGHEAVIEISSLEYDKFLLEKNYTTYYELLEKNNISYYVNNKQINYNVYDAVILSYNIHAPKLDKYIGKRVFVMHGMPTNFDGLYLPPDGFFTIAVSQFLMEWWVTHTFINHGIDTEFFKPAVSPVINNLPKKALCITRYNNSFIQTALNKSQIEYTTLSKSSPELLVSSINASDFVIAAGRSCYEAMACSKPVFVAAGTNIDGWINQFTFPVFLYKNCSGYVNRNGSESLDKIVYQLRHIQSDGNICRQIIVNNLSSELMFSKYISVMDKIQNGKYNYIL